MSQEETVIVFNLAKDIKELKEIEDDCEINDDVILSILENSSEIVSMILKRKYKKMYK